MAWEVKISDNATTQDTINLIIQTVNKYSHSAFVKALCDRLNPKGGALPFVKNLFDLVCREIEYKRDPVGHEKIYTPERTFREASGDCKKMATIIAACLKYVGIEPLLKVISYDGIRWEHIFVICKIDGQWITLDPVNKCQYNKEIPHKKSRVFNLKGESMELSMMGNANNKKSIFDFKSDLANIDKDFSLLSGNGTANQEDFLSGPMFDSFTFQDALKHHFETHKKLHPNHPINNRNQTEESITQFIKNHKKTYPYLALPTQVGNDQMEGLFDSIKKAIKKIEHTIQHTAQAIVKVTGKALKDAVGLAKKGLFFPMRNIFLGLVHKGHLTQEVLKFNLAKTLAKAINSNPNGVKDFWQFFGGDFEALKKAVREGAGNDSIHGYEYNLGEPVTIAAMLASVTPILIALHMLLKKSKVVKDGDSVDAALSAASQAGLDIKDGKGLESIANNVESTFQKVKKGVIKYDQSKASAETAATAASFFSMNDPKNILFKSVFFIGISAALPNPLFMVIPAFAGLIYSSYLLIKQKYSV